VKLEDAMQPPGSLASGRFFRTGYLPTYAAAVFLLVLLWAGAPGKHVDFGQAWRVADHLGAVQTLLVALAVALVAVILQPLQLPMVRLLEGGGSPQWPAGAQRRRKYRLAARVSQKVDAAVAAAGAQREALIQEAGALSARLRSRFPVPDHLVRPTRLGNALAAMEDSAGAAYGLDAVVTWPRLYPLLSDKVRALVDDLRDGMDAAARLAVTGTVTAIAAVALLAWHSGLLTLLALVPLAVAVLAYLGAVEAAVAYGAAVQVAFDLHRFDLLSALHMEVSVKANKEQAEQAANIALSDFLRQGIPIPFDHAGSVIATGPARSRGDKR
jgi:hypothetical protein